MDINAINSQTSTAFKNQQKPGESKMGKNQFLQLLVAQMKNQDPINPMDGTQFASQLAQFNSVEQLINLNAGMSSLASSQQMMNTNLSNTIAASLAGKSVRAYTNQIHYQAGEETPIHYKLGATATNVTIKIKDSSGNTVMEKTLKNQMDGDHTWNWDGKSSQHDTVPEGNYQIEIVAQSGDSNVKTITYVEGKAQKVRYDSNGVSLVVNGVAVSLGDVAEVSE